MERQFLTYNLQQTWKGNISCSLKSNLENPYSRFPQTPTLRYDSAWSDIRQIRGPVDAKAGKGSTEEPFAGHHCGGVSYCQGPHEAGAAQKRALTKSKFMEKEHFAGFPERNINIVFQPSSLRCKLLLNSSDKAKK